MILPETKIVRTPGELLGTGKWDEACKVLGFNIWAVNEGLLSRDEVLEFSVEQAQEVGIV